MRFDVKKTSLLLLLIASGCAATPPATQPSAEDRSKDALHDPFGYSPFGTASNAGAKPSAPPPPARKSGVGEFDRDGFNKDADHLLNP